VIAYFGTGLLGAGFVRQMLERGETVHVWNRTRAKAHALEDEGAKAVDDPRDAVRNAEQIHLTLSDDAAVDGVLEPLADTIVADALIIDHTTTAPTPTAERVRRWASRGRTFVHAPVFMGPRNAREATGLMLLSGAPEVRARVLPLLQPMTGKVIELGDDPGRAAAFKLFGNLMLLTIVGGLADMFALARGVGVDPRDALTVFDEFSLANAIPLRGRAMADERFTPPNFELSMARKDVRLMIEEARRHGDELDVISGVAALFDRYLAKGHASDDVAAVGAARR